MNANTTWRPYFLGLIGVTNWSAGASAAAISPGIASAGVMPVGIQNSAFNALPLCTHPEDVSLCDSSHLTPGTLNLPGGFGWLKFGAVGKCAGYGLGMTLDGCEENRGFLQSEIGPPANSHGCCTDVTLTPDSARRIGSAPGNKPGDLTFYVQHQVVVWVPIWDYADLTGANGYYHIVGFGAIIFDGQDVQHGKWLTGVRVSGIGNTPNASQLGATGKVELIR